MSENKRNLTEVTELIGELNGGTVEHMMNIALSDAALAAIEFARKAEVTLKIKLERIGESQQVTAVSSLAYKIPTKRGTRSEDYSIDTPLYVGGGGRMTVLPDNQLDIFTKKTRNEEARDELAGRA